jgi:hypothetical protein
MADLPLLPLHGLWIDPSPLAASPPGSCEIADDICFRKPGVLEPLPADSFVLSDPVATDHFPRRQFDARPSLQLVVTQKDDLTDNWKAEWLTVGAAPVAHGDVLLYGADPKFDSGKVQAVYYPGEQAKNGRMYLTSRKNLLRFDTTTKNLAQRAGLSAPLGVVLVTLDEVDGRAYENSTTANVRAIFKREFDDEVTPFYTGAPSTPVNVFPVNAATANLTYRIGWVDGLEEIEEIAGSTLRVEVYRTLTVPNDREPGDRMFLVGSAVVDATAIANRYIEVVDNKKDGELGEALYTNTGQEGIGAARLMPPRLADVTEYKGTLYGIVTQERQSLALYVGVPWGDLSADADARKAGIGSRQLSGVGITDTSPTVTGVPTAQFEGVAVGQLYEEISPSPAAFPAGTKILSFDVGLQTVTFDQDATLTDASENILVHDQIEIDGTLYKVERPQAMMVEWQSGVTFKLDAQFEKPVLRVGAKPYDTGQTLNLARPYAGIDAADGQFGVRATNGQFYSPQLNDLSGALENSSAAVEENRLGWCANNQPDHWPLGNRETLGTETLLRIMATAETMYSFSTEGRVYRISGFDSNLVVNVILEGTYLAGVGALDNWKGAVYAWTSRGLLEISDFGVSNLSDLSMKRELEKDYDLAVVVQQTDLFNFDQELVMEKFYGEVWLRTKVDDGDGARGLYWIINLSTAEWSRCIIPMASARYSYDERTLMFFLAGGTQNVLSRFLTVNENPIKRKNARFRLNRISGGEPAVLKQFRELVLLFQKSSAANVPMDVEVFADKAAGAGTKTISEIVALDPVAATPYTVPVSKEAGMVTQFQAEVRVANSTSEWAIEGVILREEPLVDRTGRQDRS